MNRVDPAEENEQDLTPEELIPTRASLLERLRLWSDDKSWTEFFEMYWKLLYKTGRLGGLSPIETEEMVQDTIIAVAQHMPGFRYKPSSEGGSFKNWLFNLTRWRIRDQIRRRVRNERVVSFNSPKFVGDGDEPGEILDPFWNKLEAQWEADWAKTLMEGALGLLKTRVDPARYQIFHLQAIKNWSPLKVARHLGVSISQAYTIKSRLGKELKAIVRELRRNEEGQ